MVKKKRQSKRTSLHDKYKIEKKVRQHKAKERRAARKAAKRGPTKAQKLKKDPGIPSLWPYKEQLLRQIEARRERAEAKLADQKEKRKLELQRRRSGPSAEDLARAAERSAAFEEAAAASAAAAEQNAADSASESRRQYMKELRAVVESADVVLQVLDARDPLGCRAAELENLVLESSYNKRLVLVLNKIDLVPRSVAESWLSVLRSEFPTVAFKASTQRQQDRLGRAAPGHDRDLNHSDGLCVGADTLLQLLKNYSRNKKIKTAITVGVVGYPNVGKSSLINSLKRSRAAGVSSTPGHTKTLQLVNLDKKLKLIDSPGVVWGGRTEDLSALVLRNCIDLKDLDDPVGPIEAIIQRCKPEQLMETYKVARFSSPTEFLVLVAKRRGKLGRGGVPDLKSAARTVLQDWNAGKVPFYALPPAQDESMTDDDRAEVVTSWGEEFGLDSLLDQEQSEFGTLESMDEDVCIGVTMG